MIKQYTGKEEKSLPCIKCICFPICKGKEVNDLLYKCYLLKAYMSQGLKYFNIAFDTLTAEWSKKKENIKI